MQKLNIDQIYVSIGNIVNEYADMPVCEFTFDVMKQQVTNYVRDLFSRHGCGCYLVFEDTDKFNHLQWVGHLLCIVSEQPITVKTNDCSFHFDPNGIKSVTTELTYKDNKSELTFVLTDKLSVKLVYKGGHLSRYDYSYDETVG